MHVIVNLLLATLLISTTESQYGYLIQTTSTTARPRPQQTRSLSGRLATDGDLKLNDELFNIMTLTILKGFAIFRIKMYNDRSYLDRTRRSYWFGDRYYRMDNIYYLNTRDTCAYRLNETQRKNLYYEDGTPIFDIIYQCQRYEEYCCGLDCCRYWDYMHPKPEQPRHMRTPWDLSSAPRSVLMSFVCLLCSLYV